MPRQKKKEKKDTPGSLTKHSFSLQQAGLRIAYYSGSEDSPDQDSQFVPVFLALAIEMSRASFAIQV